jgi:diguanylate cyclase (GGDEF)-like protein
VPSGMEKAGEPLSRASNSEAESGDAVPQTGSAARQGRLTVARTLKLAAIAALAFFTAATGALYLSIQSIDRSFDMVISIDQPSRDAAVKMITSADQAIVTYLDALVSDEPTAAIKAETDFKHALAEYDSLVGNRGVEDYTALANEIFGITKGLGASLIADDQERLHLFINLQKRVKRLDNVIEQDGDLRVLEHDVIQAARWISNYVAAPSSLYKAMAVEEMTELVDALEAARREAPGKERRAQIAAWLADANKMKEIEARIFLLMERADIQMGHFLRTRERLDSALNRGISQQVQASLQRRSAKVERAVDSSKSVVVTSLGVGLLLALGALYWVRKRITRPTARLMSAIEGTPEAADEVDLGRNDEFGVLARTLRESDAHRKELEEELRHQALHDPLTGLSNRALFKDRVERALARRKPFEKTIAVVFVDLDDFKTVNDSLGHAAGDELLVTVAQRINDCLRTDDTAARLGGDEFAVLLEDVADLDDVAIPAQRILEAMAMPVEVEGKMISVRASIGIALHQEDQGSAELLRNADSAMYGAKNSGKGQYKVFDESMHSAAVQRFELKNELLAVIESGQLRIHYQPVMDLDTGRKEAMEALIRWEHPERGILSPAEFIPLAEETGAIVPMGKWVLNTACVQAVDWRRDPDASDLRLSVNVSPRQLRDADFVADVMFALKTSSLPAEALILEITENVFLLNDDMVVSRLHDLAARGIVIAIDDFGSGYSSLGYLSKLPIGILKIDRSFVSGIDRGPEEGAVAQAIIRLGHTLGLEIIAEGIETAEQLAELTKRGCILGQGFLLGRPAPLDGLVARASTKG